MNLALDFLVKNNLLPYIALAVMGYVIYIQHSAGIEKDMRIAQAEASAELDREAMGHVVSYVDSRFDKIKELKKETWEKGKHEKVIYYDTK